MTILYINNQQNRIEAVCRREDPMWEEMGCEKIVVPDDFKYMVAYKNENGEDRVRDMTAAELRGAMTYADKRFGEYPPITDYIDGVVKGDEAQIQAYIDACNAVKAKYPKPEGA